MSTTQSLAARGAAELRIRPVSSALGAEVSGVDLSQPLDDAAFRKIEQAWHDGLILLFRGQDLSEEEQVRFGERFGTLAGVMHKHTGRGGHPSVMYVSNIRENGQLIGALPDGEMYFHSDQCYIERPAMATMLYAMEIPSKGGDTLFANMYRAYETLPAELKTRLEGLRAVNVYDYTESGTKRGSKIAEGIPHYAHPVFRTHPATGRKALYVNRLMTDHIVGLPREESDAILDLLFDHAEEREFVYAHTWTPGDLILWDNRCAVHARTDFDAGERRKLRRITVMGEKPY
jgi:taurine dioxygenase